MGPQRVGHNWANSLSTFFFQLFSVAIDNIIKENAWDVILFLNFWKCPNFVLKVVSWVICIQFQSCCHKSFESNGVMMMYRSLIIGQFLFIFFFLIFYTSVAFVFLTVFRMLSFSLSLSIFKMLSWDLDFNCFEKTLTWELLGHAVVLFSIFWGMSILFSVIPVPIYIPFNSVPRIHWKSVPRFSHKLDLKLQHDSTIQL